MLGNNQYGEWTQLVGACNRLVNAVRQLDRKYLAWQPWEEDALRDLYPLLTNAELGQLFGRSPHAIKTKGGAKGMGLVKLPETVLRARKQPNAGQFAKGQPPHTTQPVGSVVADPDGYLKKKIRDDLKPTRLNWVYVHRLIWEQHHGPIPAGQNVCFKDGNKHNLDIENLELVSNEDLGARNIYHNKYPKEVCQLIQLSGVLTRRINTRSKHEEQDRRSA